MHEGVWSTILGLFGLLTIAVLMVPVARKMRFPYTVLLAVVGILLGLIVQSSQNWHLGPISDLLHAFQAFDITSEVIIFVFLPALVFESSLAIDVRKLLADIGPILFLAVIGLLISTFAIAGTVSAVSGVGFVVCLLLGAILSATDPVAVVAIFKDLGAPKRLAILVEGESLFNDATAIVLFNILVAMILGHANADLFGGFLTFLKVFLGGIVVGFVMAHIFVRVIARMGGAVMAEATLTIALAYLSFLVAEHYLHVSGVMAVVTAALVIGSYGRTSISGAGWHHLQETWENLGFWANSLIFILVGIAVPGIMASFGEGLWSTLGVLLLTAFTARALITFVAVPMLARLRLGAEIGIGFRTVMWWGGLRGAVSLALALSVLENDGFAEETRNFVVALVCAFVLFTLFINATTVGFVMKFFGLDKLSAGDIAVRDRAIGTTLGRIVRHLPLVAEDHAIDPEVGDKVTQSYQERADKLSDDSGQAMGQKDWIKAGLMVLAGQERALFLSHYSNGYVSSDIARSLVARNDDLIDQIKQAGIDGYEKSTRSMIEFNRAFSITLYLHRKFGWNGPLASQLANRLDRLRTIRSVIVSQQKHALPDVAETVGEDIAKLLADVLEDRLAQTTQALNAIRLQYPDYAATLQSRYLHQIALRQETSHYNQLHHEAVIGPEIHSKLMQDLDQRQMELKKRPRLDLGLHPDELVAKIPLFQQLPPTRIAEIAALLKPRLAIPGEFIVRKGDAGNSMYLISSGALTVEVSDHTVELGSGDFFGEISLLKDTPRTADVMADSFCDLLTLDRDDFQELLAADAELRHEIEQVAEQRLADG